MVFDMEAVRAVKINIDSVAVNYMKTVVLGLNFYLEKSYRIDERSSRAC